MIIRSSGVEKLGRTEYSLTPRKLHLTIFRGTRTSLCFLHIVPKATFGTICRKHKEADFS